MSASHTTTVQANKPSPSVENKSGLRTKTIATRLTADELAEVESTAEHAGKPLSEWLRETALTAARQRTADPTELLLAELWATRYLLLNLFESGAHATVQGLPVLPESVARMRDRADARKLEEARRMLANFSARRAEMG